MSVQVQKSSDGSHSESGDISMLSTSIGKEQ
jgi:hypothetical protein